MRPVEASAESVLGVAAGRLEVRAHVTKERALFGASFPWAMTSLKKITTTRTGDEDETEAANAG